MDGDRKRRGGVRWLILGLLFLISMVTYIDRVNISIAGKEMMPEFGLSAVEMGAAFSAFVFGYALFQIPGGWLGDRWGPRFILTAAVLWWSLFTAFTAAVGLPLLESLFGLFGSLLLIRFWVGVGEAAALPNFNRAVANWLAPSERGLGIGVSIGGIGFGSALTPPVVAFLMGRYGWRMAFYVSAAAGLFVAALWFLVARDRPEEHPWVTESEAAWIGRPAADAPSRAPGFSALLRSRSVWFLTLSYTMLGYIAYIYLSWFFLYLVNVRNFTVLKGSFLATGPFLAMALFCPLGGWVTDRLTDRYGPGIGRRGVGAAGMFLTAVLIFLGAVAQEPYTAIFLLSLGAGLLYATVGAYWASTIDLSHRHSGALSGLMNMGANLGGTLSPTLTPFLGERWGWPVALGVAAGAALVGALLWFGVRFDRGDESPG
ncbi:MAG: MFS transporter [Nitrospirae bacterium]|nr:MFS transporter [Candidatus Manganitrophaceae bacterium]